MGEARLELAGQAFLEERGGSRVMTREKGGGTVYDPPRSLPFTDLRIKEKT